MKKQTQQEQEAFSNQTTLSSKTELEAQLRVDALLEKSQSEQNLPWTEEELIAAGIEERHWQLQGPTLWSLAICPAVLNRRNRNY